MSNCPYRTVKTWSAHSIRIVSIAYDFPAQDSPVKISAQKGVFSHVTVGDLDIKGYSVEDYIRAAADRLFRNID